MAHAHPATDGHLSQSTSRPSHLFRPSPPPDPLIARNSSFPQEGFHPNSRRLHLRNTGFRGTILPTRRISPFGHSSTVPELSNRHSNEDISPRTAEKRATYGENLPSSPVSILQELSNSSRRKRTPRQSLVGIFEDADTQENRPPELMGSSWLNEAGIDSSPAARPGTPLKMKAVRKIPSPEKENAPPPQSSPIPKQLKVRRKTRLHNRSTSFDASRYIEHLESELAALNTRVDALTCPTTTRAHNAKIRNLTNQVRSLRLEVSAWETKFDERVADEVSKRLEIEADLRKALRRLEYEKEVKDFRIQELEGEVDHAQIKVKEADSLATTNQDLERRVDTLTQLLAQSPTRQEYQHPLPSPDKVAFTQRVPRPRSLLPRIPSSPVLPRRLSLNVPTSATWRSTSFQFTDRIPETPEECTPARAPNVLEDDDSTPQPNPRSRPTSESMSQESNSLESGILSSRPTSITSSTSSTSAPWSSRHSSHALEDPRSVSRTRRMRRFPSGTGSLKPLILPTSVNGSSLPASAPLSRSSFASSYGVSDSYFDPAAAFSSIAEIANLSSPVNSPCQPQRRRSASWARNQALNALEGKPYFMGDDEDIPGHSSDFVPKTCSAREVEPGANSNETPPRQRLSLEFELSRLSSTLTTPEIDSEQPRDVNSDPDGVSPSAQASPKTDCMQPPNSVLARFETPSPLHHKPSIPPDSGYVTRNAGESLRRKPTLTAKPFVQSQSLIARQTGPNTTVALLSRLTTLVTSMRDPMMLARRILHNAWTRTSTPKAHGGLGWWLMGLVYRSYHRFEKSDLVPCEIDQEDDNSFSAGRRDSNIDWHQYYSAEASKQRRVSAFIGDEAFAQYQIKDQTYGLEPPLPVRSPDEECLRIPEAKDSASDEQPIRCKDCVEPAGRQSLRLWLRFSLAVVLAIGVAIKDGPGVLMGGEEERSSKDTKSYDESNDANDKDATTKSMVDSPKPEPESEFPIAIRKQQPVLGTKIQAHDEAGDTNEEAPIKDNDDEEYWGWELTFKNYTAEDFEDGKEPATPAS